MKAILNSVASSHRCFAAITACSRTSLPSKGRPTLRHTSPSDTDTEFEQKLKGGREVTKFAVVFRRLDGKNSPETARYGDMRQGL